MARIKTTIRIDEDLYESIKVMAKSRRMTVQDLMDQLLRVGYMRFFETSIYINKD